MAMVTRSSRRKRRGRETRWDGEKRRENRDCATTYCWSGDGSGTPSLSLRSLGRNYFNNIHSIVLIAVMWNIWKRRNSKLFWDVYEELHITASKIVDDLIYFGPTAGKNYKDDVSSGSNSLANQDPGLRHCYDLRGCNEDKTEDFQVQDVSKEPCKRSRSYAQPLQPAKA
ncbi:hypothetical protein TRIUR3_31545 [Triticum urartu]|uniref:Uncharacterized protein n=1 Tax=Triticum urartu TaxID=4572 RepID=M7ZXY1_TRIUA|nr:hypothetical protein TRIUR3_31545 [Triticum urartu]